MKLKEVLGIDIGGSGIKGAIVHTKKGKLLTDRYRIKTPQPARPESVVDVIEEIRGHFKWKGAIGAGFPGIVRNGVVFTAANLHDSWKNVNINSLLAKKTGCKVHVLNDADAAGHAEMKYGAGKGHKGVVMLVTVGTGIGTVIFTGGKLLPNLELGHIILKGDDAERYASDAARKQDEINWEEWGKRFNEYLLRLEFFTSPDLFIIGGGASKKLHKFKHTLTPQAKVVHAELLNEAGIIGASLAARIQFKD